MKCRCCQSSNTTILGNGMVAPFFVKRVKNVHICTIAESILQKTKNNPITFKKKLIRNVLIFVLKLRIFNRFFNLRPVVNTNIRVCNNCTFIGPDEEYSYDSLERLNVDYRSSSYNNERCIYEPDYRFIMNELGKSEKEIANRLNNVERIIQKNIDISAIKTVIDWGGGEGRFVPRVFTNPEVYILDVSNEPLHNIQYKRVDKVPDFVKADFIQFCHILEHVISPFTFIEDALLYVKEGGYIYIEVPLDKSEQEIEMIASACMQHHIHEHINLFSEQALHALASSHNLEIITIEKVALDFGWAKTNILSGLFLKKRKYL